LFQSCIKQQMQLNKTVDFQWTIGRFRGTCPLHLQGLRISQAKFCLPPALTLVSSLCYSSILNTGASCSSETSVDFQWALQRFKETCRLHPQGLRISHARFCLPTASTLLSSLGHSSTLKIEATYCSATSVDFQLTIRHYNPEDKTLKRRISSRHRILSTFDGNRNHHTENLVEDRGRKLLWRRAESTRNLQTCAEQRTSRITGKRHEMNRAS
jgi:hypothetical protein